MKLKVRSIFKESLENHTTFEDAIKTIDDSVNSFKILQQHLPDIVLSGSVALMLQGKMPLRKAKDLDIVGISKIHSKYEKEVDENDEYNDNIKYEIHGITFDYFVDESSAKRNIVKYKGMIIPCSRPEDIMKAKFRYAVQRLPSSKKHAREVSAWLTQF